MKKKSFTLLVIVSIMILSIFASVTAITETDDSIAASEPDNTSITADSVRQTPSGIPFSAIENDIDRYVEKYIGVTSPGAAIVVFSEGEIVFSKGYGYSDIGNSLPVNPGQTVFEYGSVSKIFVYTTLMQLAEDKKLKLDDDIRLYLPDGFLKNLRYDEPITFLDIMNHQAGFEDVLFDTVITDPPRKTGFLDTLKANQPEQVYRPGTVSAYSNFAVALAAYIAQTQLDQDFYSYLGESVFKPLSMNSTTAHPDFLDQPQLKNGRAKGYAQNAAGTFQEVGWSYIPLYPVGAVSGTAEDLARFAISLMPPAAESGPLYDNRATLDEMLSQTMSMGPGMTGFAHGFIEKDGAYRGLGHGGNTAAFTAQLNIVPEKRFGVIVLANAASEMELTEGVTRLLLGTGEGMQSSGSSKEKLPDASKLEGSYIAARRPHNGFLKIYGFLNLFKVESESPDTIRISYAGQSADYFQTKPYLFVQTAADGSIFNYNFEKVYFEMAEDNVFRISGDFLPLPAGHSVNWLIFDVLLAVLSAVFFLIVPLILLTIGFIRRIRGTINNKANSTVREWPLAIMLLSGFGLLTNSAILVLRMLQDNHRAFSEVKLQLLLNYPLALTGLIAAIISVFGWKNNSVTGGRRSLKAAALLMLLGLFYLMIKWQFLSLTGL